MVLTGTALALLAQPSFGVEYKGKLEDLIRSLEQSGIYAKDPATIRLNPITVFTQLYTQGDIRKDDGVIDFTSSRVAEALSYLGFSQDKIQFIRTHFADLALVSVGDAYFNVTGDLKNKLEDGTNPSILFSHADGDYTVNRDELLPLTSHEADFLYTLFFTDIDKRLSALERLGRVSEVQLPIQSRNVGQFANEAGRIIDTFLFRAHESPDFKQAVDRGLGLSNYLVSAWKIANQNGAIEYGNNLSVTQYHTPKGASWKLSVKKGNNTVYSANEFIIQHPNLTSFRAQQPNAPDLLAVAEGMVEKPYTGSTEVPPLGEKPLGEPPKPVLALGTDLTFAVTNESGLYAGGTKWVSLFGRNLGLSGKVGYTNQAGASFTEEGVHGTGTKTIPYTDKVDQDARVFEILVGPEVRYSLRNHPVTLGLKGGLAHLAKSQAVHRQERELREASDLQLTGGDFTRDFSQTHPALQASVGYGLNKFWGLEGIFGYRDRGYGGVGIRRNLPW